MDIEDGSVGELPAEIIERVLSFLPVPVLCRCRSVCKGWNELVAKPSFHALWELNGNNQPYLFAVRSVQNMHDDCEYRDPIFLQTMCFFDVHERRWYSIKAEDLYPVCDFLPEWFLNVFASMDNGLICELTKSPEGTQIRSLVLTDPVAETKREVLVPLMPCHFFFGRPHFPVVVTAWHRVAGGLQIFLLNNGLDTDETQIYVQESSTGGWRDLGIPPKELGVRKALAAVIFQGVLYVIFHSHTLCRDSFSPLCVLVSYNLEKDTWREVPVSLPTRVGTTVRWFYPLNLIVSGDRLFLMMWGHGEPGGEDRFHTPFHTFFATIEILVRSNNSKVVVHMPTTCAGYQDPDGMHHYFSGLFSVGYGVPCIDSDGNCSSVVWVTEDKGEVAVYDMASGSMTDLPPHPLGKIHGINNPQNDMYLSYRYRWKYMSLNCRKILSISVVTNAQYTTT